MRVSGWDMYVELRGFFFLVFFGFLFLVQRRLPVVSIGYIRGLQLGECCSVFGWKVRKGVVRSWGWENQMGEWIGEGGKKAIGIVYYWRQLTKYLPKLPPTSIYHISS